MEFERLARYNHWWVTGKVREHYLIAYRRPIFYKLLDYIDDRQILLITGLRGVGKTTLFYQIIQQLLDRKAPPDKILYFSFDEVFGDIENVLKVYQDMVLKKNIAEGGRIYIFFDEIQKFKGWQNKIKIFYDLYPNVKFFVSGSASINLQKRSKESLAGRTYDFVLQPLSFEEFLKLKGLKVDKDRLELAAGQIAPLLFDYMQKGGFPEIIDETNDDKIRKYVHNSIIEKVIYKDLPVEFGLKDLELLTILIRMVAENPGMILNVDNLSKDLHRNKRTIMDYISYLEYSLILRIVYNYREGFMVSSRKLRKLYLTNTAIAFGFVNNLTSKSFLEKLAVNIVIIKANATHYYRNDYEIDAIVKENGLIVPIEVKYGKPTTARLIKFLQQFDVVAGILVTREIFKKEVIDDKLITFIPLWAFLLMEPSQILK